MNISRRNLLVGSLAVIANCFVPKFAQAKKLQIENGSRVQFIGKYAEWYKSATGIFTYECIRADNSFYPQRDMWLGNIAIDQGYRIRFFTFSEKDLIAMLSKFAQPV